MKCLLSCASNFDTVCVELKFSDCTMIAIDTIAVENEAADNIPTVITLIAKRPNTTDLQFLFTIFENTLRMVSICGIILYER